MGIGIFHHIGPLLLVTAFLAPAQAGEYAILNNGFRLHAERHEVDGSRIRLYEGAGVTEMASEDIASFEQEEAKPSVASAPAPVIEAPVVATIVAKDIYTKAAEKHGLPVALVRSVVRAESNFQEKAVSPKGAIGLMQLMPETARELGVNPNIPEQNVEAGTRYLRDLLIKYEGSEDQVAKAIAAYNAGPAAVDRYKGVPPYLETQSYVRRVLRDYLKSEN